MINLDSARRNLFTAADVRLVEQFRTQIEVSLMARARYEASLQRFNIDALTGLSTRGLFEDLFMLSVERANRYGEAFVLALFDADGLKRINDRLGHLAGDQYLLAMAGILRLAHRKSDILGRFGGDEFIAVYHDTSAAAMHMHLLDLLGECRERPVDIGGEKVPVLFSFGLASYPENGRSLKELIAAADGRLYGMKAEHRGQA
jgi:diguanylate cyclase (GGDEF)-like protein